MKKLLATIWLQYGDTDHLRINQLADLVDTLMRLRPDRQSRRIEISAGVLKKERSDPDPSKRINRGDASTTVRGISLEQLSSLRISCGLVGKNNAFHNEAWSAELTSGKLLDSGKDECCVCFDMRALMARGAYQDQCLMILDILIKHHSIISGVCDVSRWSDTIGGEYYLRSPWHGFDRSRCVRRNMWNQGGSTRQWVRDLGWMTLVGDAICRDIPAWDAISSGFGMGPDNVTSVRRQVVVSKPYGTVFVAAHDPIHYFEEPVEECSLLNGWLGLQLRMHNALM